MTNYWHKTTEVPSSLKLHSCIFDYIDSEATVIDLGCSEGATISLCCNKVKYASGIDINFQSLKKGKTVLPENVDFICGSLTDLPFGHNTFDLGMLQAVLTVIDKVEIRKKILNEVYGVINKYIYISDFLQTWSDPYYRDRYIKGLKETGEVGSFIVKEKNAKLYQAHHFAKEELRDLLCSSNFSLCEVHKRKVRTRSGNEIDGIIAIAKKVRNN